MPILCPCHSGKSYESCCQPFHAGTLPQNALQLMRSRYAAYALRMPTYIIGTTHPSHPRYRSDQAQWEREILVFCRQTTFEDLQIIAFIDGKQTAYVTFFARLSQQGQDVSFEEKSLFEKENGRWLYKSGSIR